MVQTPHHCNDESLQRGCSTRRRRECSRVGVVIGVMLDVAAAEARFQPEPAPLFAASLVTQLALNASRTPLGLEGRGLT